MEMSSATFTETDLESYATKYCGLTKLKRLLFIADNYPPVQGAALKMAITELKQGSNTEQYFEVMAGVGTSLGEGYSMDDIWIEETKQKAKQEHDRLEAELNRCRAVDSKSETRKTYQSLGQHYFDIGDLPQAFQYFMKARESSNDDELVDIFVRVLKICIFLGNFHQVPNYVSMAQKYRWGNSGSSTEASKSSGEKDPLPSQLSCFSGLMYLDSEKYESAADSFLEVSADLGSSINDLLHIEDVAIYATLCALASFNREKLKRKCVDSNSFKSLLNHTPRMKEVLLDFNNSRYHSCLSTLDSMKDKLMLDLHLRKHVENIYQRIRSAAMVQYFSPYSSVDMHQMATVFNIPLEELHIEVAKLIIDEKISARIDTQKSTLFERETDQRKNTFQHALKVGDDYIADTKTMLLRLSLMKNGISVSSNSARKHHMMQASIE